MLILEMDWTLFWTALSGIGGLAAVITIIIAITNNRKKKRNTLMQTCNDLCEAMSIGNINTLLNKIFIICDRGMPETSANIEIHNHLERIVKEVQAKWKEMRQQLQSSKQRNMLAQMEAIVEEYHYCFRDVETIVAALGCESVDEIEKHISDENSQEMRDIISNTSNLYDEVPPFIKQMISLRFKDLEVPNYAAEIQSLFNNQYENDRLLSLRLYALMGDAIAQKALGKYYESQKQFDKAFAWFMRSSKQGLSDAMFSLGVYYNFGMGVEKDEKKAFDWLMKSAENGNAMGQAIVGIIYANGEKGVEKDEKKAFDWFMKSAENGNAMGQFHLGLLYSKGKGVKKDETKAFEWYMKSAKQGYAEAQNNLSILYRKGKGVKKNEKEAIKWLKKSAEQGDEAAQDNLGMCYEYGVIVEKDEKKAFEWYMKSAEQGYAKAQFNTGRCYNMGMGVEPDKTKAFEWYMKSAEQGCASGCFEIGLCYLKGEGCLQNYDEASRWFNEVRKDNNDVSLYNEAIYMIGTMHSLGEIGFGSDFKATEYFSIAAQNGYSPAQYELGYFYENGIGVKEADIEKAKYWYKEAAKQGDEESIAALNKLNSIGAESN